MADLQDLSNADTINLINPLGDLVSVPKANSASALQQGYTQPTAQDVHNYQIEEQYGGLGQGVVAGAEALGRGLVGPLMPAAERAVGVSPEAIRGREEAHPYVSGLGEAAGFGAGLLTGTGEAQVLERAGIAAAEAGARALPAAAKLGSTTAKIATEMALFQGGDELSKMITQDPNQSLGSAMANIGVAGLLGGAAGPAIVALSPLAKAVQLPKIGALLDGLKTKMGGIDGLMEDNVSQAFNRLGLHDVAPEIKASLSGDRQMQEWASTLMQTDVNASGQAYQEARKGFSDRLDNALLNSLGRTAETIPEDVSQAEQGRKIGEALHADIAPQISEQSKEFEEIKDRFKDAELPQDQITETRVKDPNDLLSTGRVVQETIPGATSRAADAISKLAEAQGWNTMQSSDIMKEVKSVLSDLPGQKTLKNFSDFISQVGDATSKDKLNGPLLRAGGLMVDALRDVESDVIGQKLGAEAPELLERYNTVKSEFKNSARLKKIIDDRLNIKGSVSGFPKRLMEMAKTDGESILRRLSGKGDADWLAKVQENFPNAAQAIKDAHLDSAVHKAINGKAAFSKTMESSMEKMSPELRDFVYNPEQIQKMRDIGTIRNQLDAVPYNYSNTARTVDKLMGGVPANVGALAAVLTGHPLVGAALGGLGKFLTRDTPDAIKLGLLKYMGSREASNPSAFVGMVDYLRNVMKGERQMGNAVNALIKGSAIAVPVHLMNQEEKIDKKVAEYSKDQGKMMALTGDLGHYMPGHDTALSYTASQAVSYLSQLKPQEKQGMILDAKYKDPIQEQAYNRALEISANPLRVVQNIKDGTITSHDINTLNNVAPGFASRLRQKMTEAMVEHVSEGETIPYKTRVGMALFLGQPLDSTMTPQSIMAAQIKPPVQMPHPTGGNMKSLAKMPQIAMTENQSRLAARSGRA